MAEDAPAAAPAGDAPAAPAAEGWVGPDGKTYASKNAYKKAMKDAEKAKKKGGQPRQERGQKAAIMTQADPADKLKDQYGDYERIQSKEQTDRKWIPIAKLNAELKDQKVLIRGRLSTTRSTGAKGCFLSIRRGTASVQAVMFANDETVSRPMVKYASQIPKESIVDVEGTISVPETPIASCSQSDVELHVTFIKVVSRAGPLPFELADAARSDAEVASAAEKGEVLGTVARDTRLNNRHLDIRTAANQGIFRVQGGVCALFREFLLSEGFTEIHSPKLIGGASEGGAEVFTLKYVDGSPACLAQSPQLYKQMAICADLERVFEIGPVFRAEKSFTHRHLCEFTGLDFEMEIKEHYFEALDVVEGLFGYIFEGLQSRFATELAAVKAQYPFEDFKFKPVRITFKEGIQMLKDAGHEASFEEDINTEMEKALGKLVREKYDTDFYTMIRYPLAVRPFYTMPAVDDPTVSNSYDVFMRGEEIISGAQRIHDPDLLIERAKAWEIPIETIQPYIDSFRLGASPHAGVGVGLERVVMLFAALNNIRLASMFPRDPVRLAP